MFYITELLLGVCMAPVRIHKASIRNNPETKQHTPETTRVLHEMTRTINGTIELRPHDKTFPSS